MFQTLPQRASFDQMLSPIIRLDYWSHPNHVTDITRGPLILASVRPLETSTEPRSVTVLEASAAAVLIGGELSRGLTPNDLFRGIRVSQNRQSDLSLN